MKQWRPKEIKQVVLINLPYEGKVADFYTPKYVLESFSNYPPLGLLHVATGIKDHYPVSVVDCMSWEMSIDETVDEIVRQKADILGISCQTFYVYPMYAIMEKIRERMPDITIVVGGPHVMAFPEETINLENVDYCIEGDGDVSFKILLDCIHNNDPAGLVNAGGLIYYDENNQLHKNAPDQLDLDELPIPDRSILGDHKYYTAADNGECIVTMVSSRGCPFKCVYCDVLEKQYRTRSAKSVADEMEHISKTYDNPIIHVFDDTFNLYKKRVMEICEEIISRGLKVRWTTRSRTRPLDEEMMAALKEAGVVRMHFGVESGSELTLKNIKKGLVKKDIIRAFELCNEYEVDSMAYFIIGFNWETKKEINETVRFIKNIRPTFILASTLYPLAETETYETLLASGQLSEDFWLSYAKNPTPDFQLPEYLNPKSLTYLRRKLDEVYINFYLSPRFILRNLTQKGSGQAGNLLFKAVLAYTIVASYLKNFVKEILTSGVNDFAQPVRAAYAGAPEGNGGRTMALDLDIGESRKSKDRQPIARSESIVEKSEETQTLNTGGPT